jgi:uncharacterized protein (DUF1684 family)
MDEWAADLERERKQKDMFFLEHPKSPLSQSARETFDGLGYYEPDPAFRFTIPLRRADDPETVTVETTNDNTQTYERCGWFEFRVDDTDCRLWAYRTDTDTRLWVPFRDSTNGEETYGGGRYIDLEEDDRDGDDWVLDFNRAYTPFCVYTDDYDCPLVPEENSLDVPVRAGETFTE